MGALLLRVLFLIFATTYVYSLPNDKERRRKAIGIFNVVKFPNEVCIGSGSQNGTCYTQEECSSRDGVSSGSCADGYGVCCVITLSCGSTTSENCTYLSQSASTNPSVDPADSGTCKYEICPATTSINRIRLDLTMFQIAGPVGLAADSVDGDGNANSLTNNEAVGHCTTDSFVVSGAPVICGFNTGQHMIVDTDGVECISATFAFSGATETRNYQIHVLQYDRSNSLDLAGAPGCLQYMTGMDGIVSTFNWNGVGDVNGPASIHLANQEYNICVRQAADRCILCWQPTTIANIGSFGISNGASVAAAPKSGAGVKCPMPVMVPPEDSADFITIAFGNDAMADLTNADAVTMLANIGETRFCGRYLSGVAAGVVASVAVCTRRSFQLGVHFDNFEAAGLVNDAAKNEAFDGAKNNAAADYGMPTGTIGFQLRFNQVAC